MDWYIYMDCLQFRHDVVLLNASKTLYDIEHVFYIDYCIKNNIFIFKYSNKYLTFWIELVTGWL